MLDEHILSSTCLIKQYSVHCLRFKESNKYLLNEVYGDSFNFFFITQTT